MGSYQDKIADKVVSILSRELVIFKKSIDTDVLRLHEYVIFLINLIFYSGIFKSLESLTAPHFLLESLLERVSFKNKIDLLFSKRMISAEFHSRLKKLNSARRINAHVKVGKGQKTTNPEAEVKYFLTETSRIILKNLAASEIKQAAILDELSKLGGKE